VVANDHITARSEKLLVGEGLRIWVIPTFGIVFALQIVETADDICGVLSALPAQWPRTF
jgi:hypothetical protein